MLAFARSARNAAAVRQTARKPSCTASSASRSSRSDAQREAVCDAPDPVVELRKRGLVAPGDERDQGLVGEMSVLPAHRPSRARTAQR